MKRLEAVIFDCDGVVVDSDALQRQAEQETAEAFAEQHSLPYNHDEIDWNSMQGWSRKKIAANIFGVNVESEHADNFRLAVVEKTVEIACADNLPLIDGVSDFVNYLRMHGLSLGLATASNRKIYARYCEVNPMDFFRPDYIVAHGECIDDKPKPGPFLEVMSRMHASPEQTLIIEDSSSGITAGRYAGGVVLALATTKSEEFLKDKTGAHIVANDYKTAANLIQDRLSA